MRGESAVDDIFSVIFFIWIAFAFLEGIVRKKKIPPSPQLPSEDTNFSLDQNVIDIAQPVEIKQLNPKPNSQPKKVLTEQFKTNKPKDTNLNLEFTPADTMNAMILSEIFSKPKALRKR